ncbi:MAG: hypothetical protein P4L79_18600 [Legionella sp.]|uniref:hypothetical protein n=1 Tax=Legionella sp. TaxID=459 RepID=UPI00284C9376|nr:hypothetical protein [Legionella sp.]
MSIELNRVRHLDELLEIKIQNFTKDNDIATLDYVDRHNQFIDDINKLFQSFKMNTGRTHLFEYSMFHALNCLPLVRQFDPMLKLRFELSKRYPDTVRILFGISSEKYNAKDPEFFQLIDLKQHVTDALNASEAINAPTVKKYCGNKANIQYHFYLPQITAIRMLLSNPLFMSHFLLTDHSSILNKQFLRKSCLALRDDIQEFKGLPKGPKDKVIDQLGEELISAIKVNPSIIFSHTPFFKDNTVGVDGFDVDIHTLRI